MSKSKRQTESERSGFVLGRTEVVVGEKAGLDGFAGELSLKVTRGRQSKRRRRKRVIEEEN